MTTTTAQSGALREASAWLGQLETALAAGDTHAAAALFAKDSYWRDLVAFSWNIVTVEGPDEIRQMLERVLGSVRPSALKLDGDAEETDGLILFWFSFKTATGSGRGCVRLRDGRCWIMFTALRELEGFAEQAGPTREEGIDLGARKDKQSWRQQQDQIAAELGVTTDPYVVIVGASQGGLALAARLKQLDIPALVIDRLERPGDSWRHRYGSLCLHDPVWSDHMPYIPFPATWPVYTPKDRMADWLEMYAKVLALNIWCRTECRSASYDEAGKKWNIVVDRNGTTETLRANHLVLATGLSGIPRPADIRGAETFAGAQMHSSAFRGGADFAGKRCVVIGSNNSAHDICQELWENGADVTMIQRSPTLVVRLMSLRRIVEAGPFSEAGISAGITTDEADLMAASMPYAQLHHVAIANYAKIRTWDADFYDRLRGAGFQLHFGEDDSGILMMYLRRAAGYYIDVGASDLIADGEIKLVSGKRISHMTAEGLTFEDGSTLPADLVVHATGYGSMEGWAERLISPQVARRVGRCWGLGSDTRDDPGPWVGELRNMWKPTAQEGLWFQGGNLAQARHYSLYLALQLKARLEGLPIEVYPS